MIINNDPLLCNSSASTKAVTDYCGNVIYQNGSLKEILAPEGYWQNGIYYYYLKDHQGNTRIELNQNNVQVEISHYYPNGMRFESSKSNSAALPYRYNGKELESMNELNEYDYGARRRETGIPVWTAMDPLAEKYYSISPYVYAVNNPIYYVDPLGMNVVENDKTYTISGDDVYTYFGVMQEIANGYSSMNTLQSALHNASQKNKGKGGKMDQTLDEFTVTASAPKKQGEVKAGRSWLYSIIGKLDGNKELDSRINPYIPSPKEINSEVDMEMQIALLFMPTDVVGIAASMLVKIGYSATQQFLLKSILYAMEHPKTVGLVYGAGSFAGGLGFGLYQANKLPLAPDIPLINSNSINSLLDDGVACGSAIENIIATPSEHQK